MATMLDSQAFIAGNERLNALQQWAGANSALYNSLLEAEVLQLFLALGQASDILTVCSGYATSTGNVPCGKVLGTKDGKGQSGISHEYCPACFKKQMEQK